MKKILWLISREFRLLGKTVAIIFAILTVFLGVLIGAVTVSIDLPRNLYINLDCAEYTFALTAYGVAYGGITEISDDALVLGFKSGLTGACTLNANGEEFSTAQTYTENGIQYITVYRGAAVCLNQGARSAFESIAGVIDGEGWLTEDYGICLSTEIADVLNARVGDTVEISGYSFKVTGVYRVEEADVFSQYHYLISVENGFMFDSINAYFGGSRALYGAYSKLNRMGYETEIADSALNAYFDNISTLSAFLTAAAAVFALTSAALMCVLATIFFRHRRTYICQLKLLGGKESVIIGIYCGIALIMLLAATIAASLLAFAFNAYFIGLCADVMGMSFTARFYIYVPVAAFFVLAAVTAAVYTIFAKKTRTAAVAQYIRHE